MWNLKRASESKEVMTGISNFTLSADGKKLLYSKDKEEAGRVLEAMGRALEQQVPTSDISLAEWLSQYTKDERILKVFQPVCNVGLLQNIYDIQASKFFSILEVQKDKPWNIERFWTPICTAFKRGECEYSSMARSCTAR